MTQQGPPSPEPGWTPGGRSRRSSWQDEGSDDEDYAAWVGQSILPRYADQEERDRRRLGGPRPGGVGDAGGQAWPGRFGRRGRQAAGEGQDRSRDGEDWGPAADEDRGQGTRPQAQSGRPPAARPGESQWQGDGGAQDADRGQRAAWPDGGGRSAEGGWPDASGRGAGARHADDSRAGDADGWGQGRAGEPRRAGSGDGWAQGERQAGIPRQGGDVGGWAQDGPGVDDVSRWAENTRRDEDAGWAVEVASSAGRRRSRDAGREEGPGRATGGRRRSDDAARGQDDPGVSSGLRRDEADGAGDPPRLSRTRSAAGRIRRGRRAIWFRAALLVVVIAIGMGAWLIVTRKPAPKAVAGGLVTSFLPGEFTKVPDACSSLSSATLNAYVPGKRNTLAPRSLYGALASGCSWSVDASPLYRLLQVSIRAYAPNGLAKGNGSATEAAIGAYQQAQARKQHPPKGQRAARVAFLPEVGQTAFSATQSPSSEGATTDMVTVVVREHNVLVTVVYEGLITQNGKYSGVSMAKIQAGAQAVAREVLTRLH